jgi:fumarate reductase subunit C
MTLRLYLLQRATAALMVPLIVVHVVVIFYATRHGLTAADILARTRGSAAWVAFYGVFVMAAALHAAIGMRNILAEWTTLKGRMLDGLVFLFGMTLLLLGARAVVAVVSA